jgi:hypothetical protein
LLIAAREYAFPAGVNVSAATCGGRFSGVHQWPVLSVRRGRKNKLPSAIANVTDAGVFAEQHRMMAEPGSGQRASD